MSFKDVFKQKFLDNFTSGDVSTTNIIVVLVLTCIISCYIFAVYRTLTKKTFYSKTFNISIACLAVITASFILAIQSNIVISLGMVGALSIVRFRTAVKDPLDLCFMFWSIAVGICCGAHMAEIAIVLSAIMTILVIGLDRLPVGQAPMILIVNMVDSSKEPSLEGAIREFSRSFKVRSRNIRNQSCNYVIELRVKKEAELVNKILLLDGVIDVSLVSHDGEVTF